ncbi:hypothetical protein TRIP_E190184 [uncultured Spirochaetota bacterium]|uniref:Uncharacterized protein n=1 Tax=uncultured Spirochaetota bacterium TaxID=460511 RepID=A0A652ZU24_9SPIR|nr:hypothetical protein TRIP_E190184 [uncultured Spirochaetota bacterium]
MPGVVTRRLRYVGFQFFHHFGNGNLPEGGFFDLSDSFLGEMHAIADFLQAHGASSVNAEAIFDNLSFLYVQQFQDLVEIILEVQLGGVILGALVEVVFDEIAHDAGVLLVVDGAVQGYQIPGHGDDFGHMVGIHIEVGGHVPDLLVLRESFEVFAGFFDLDKFVRSVERKADHAAFLADSLENGLAYPPDGVRNEVKTLADIVALDGVHQADVAFGDEVRKGEPLVLIFLGDVDHKTKVGFYQHILGEAVALGGSRGVVVFLFSGEKGNPVDLFEVDRENVFFRSIVAGVHVGILFAHLFSPWLYRSTCHAKAPPVRTINKKKRIFIYAI